MRLLFIILTHLTFLAGLSSCQTTGSRLSNPKKNSFYLEDTKFDYVESADKVSGWRVIEIKPAQLPYAGTLAQWSAQDRWIKLFEKSLEMVNQECGQPISHLPEIKGDQADYFKLGKSGQHPKFVRIRFSCK